MIFAGSAGSEGPMRAIRTLLAGGALPLVAGAMEFADRTGEAGLSYFQHQLPEAGPGSIPRLQAYFSGGAAAGDFDNDGFVDLYVTRLDDSNILFRNRGDGTFEDRTAAAFGANHLGAFRSNGCAWGDIDNDGDLDLYVTGILATGYHLFINDGTGSFSEESFARGAKVFSSDTHYGQSVSFGDYDLDGFLDIHVTEWRSDGENPSGARHNNRLLRNLGIAKPGHFADVTIEAGVATDEVPPSDERLDSQGYAPRFSDLDRDGIPDLLLASDHRTSRLFWGEGDGTFTDGTVAAGVGTDRFGMGSAVGDYDMDGDLDWFVTSIHEEGGMPSRDGNRLYRNEGGRRFSDDTDGAGVRNGRWAWAAAFADFDHDRDLDLMQVNGLDFPHSPSVSAGFERDPTRLWENDGTGVFSEVAVASGVADQRSGKGLLTFDYDNDGDLDAFVVNNGAEPVLYENLGADGGDWLILRPVGTQSNRQGLGAFITVVPEEGAPPLVRELSGGSNFLGQDEAIAHFGLGSLPRGRVASVRIEWPGGEVQTLREVPVNRSYRVSEPLGTLPGFELSLERRPHGELLFEWDTEPSADYELQVCLDLAIPHWVPCRELHADGPRAAVTLGKGEREAIGPAAFFRVIRR